MIVFSDMKNGSKLILEIERELDVGVMQKCCPGKDF